ncbi:LysE family translocator [Pseudodesulfovibrio cashew]|uniref:LysE family translocator n=1 Tax=Pseudodesulfovibrio cashew TaxID=2678688 RepID=A0A6I6JHZ9_9BACT|nr:LysE family translocator [Pseudodesulfovibrio cashew]QGY41831.1 LysE family translocator [Pseudodesulfovibrio cashew]
MFSLIAAMCIFSLTMSISPGPVNMTIIASGATHGFRKTFPFVSGATIGFILLLLSLGFGLTRFVTAYPAFLRYLSVAGSAFIIYVGYKIATAPPDLSIEEAKCPGFRQGVLMQWLNPKAWLACIAGLSLFTDANSPAPFLLFSGLYFIICYLSLSAWAVLGKRVGLLLNTRKSMKVFSMSMGSLLGACAAYLLLTSLQA